MSAHSMRSKQPPFTIFSDYTATIPEYLDDCANEEQEKADNQKHEREHKHDYEARYSMSPSPYDADGGLSSDENEPVVQSIEARMSGRKSSAAFTTVSSIPPSIATESDISPYTPHKGPRPAFRTPSSVRAMHMASPPPFYSPRGSRQESPLSSPRRRRPETPSSVRSGSILHNARHSQVYEDERSGHGSGRSTPLQTPARGPLVLLHVTVLPCPGLPYSMESLNDLAPAFVQKNWGRLQEKLTETVLSRGVLIPHPGEEFDMLEESLLETLGLCAPRIGSCGHFYGPEQDLDSDSGNDSAVSDLSGDGSKIKALCARSHDASRVVVEEGDDDMCGDCDQPMRIPGKGIGSGNLRWDIKIYAANGLMRAGAWGAAWREMERVDVEIEPWIPEAVRKALDMRLEQEEDKRRQQHEELERMRFRMADLEKSRREAEEERAWLESERARTEERAAALERDLELAEAVQASQSLQQLALSAPNASSPTLPESSPYLEPRRSSFRASDARREASLSRRASRGAQEIPLTTLLRNYITLLVQDRRNIALGLLSILVIFLALCLAAPSSRHQVGDHELQVCPLQSSVEQTSLSSVIQDTDKPYSESEVSVTEDSLLPCDALDSMIADAPHGVSSPASIDLDFETAVASPISDLERAKIPVQI